MAAFTRCRHETTEFETVTLTVQVSCNNFVLKVVNRNDFLPLSFTNISGGAAPILASVIGVSPKTWRISASADARSTPYGSSA